MRRFLPYGTQWIDADDVRAVKDVLRSAFLTQGPKVAEFEDALRERTGAKYAVAVANGTAALHLAVAALRIPRGKTGITSPITFAASANCFIYSGLRPSFADIDPRTFNLDPAELKKRIGRNTALVIPVHFAGQPADMKAIHRIARKHTCRVIEDATHAIGSRYDDGTPVGNCAHSDMTVFSFHPVKTITTGEGGAITTNDDELHQRLMTLRTHGITKEAALLSQNPGPWYYEIHDLGFNYRLTDIQAALGISQLKKLEAFIARRREIVARYNEAFAGEACLTIPYERCGVFSAFHLYVLQIDFAKIGKSRRDVMEALRRRNIGTQVHYIPVPQHPYYAKRYRFRIGEFPKAEAYYERALSLPLFPRMSDADVDYVAKSMKEVLRGA